MKKRDAKLRRLNIPVAQNIASIVPYPPGKPIEELERELGITGSIKLASNENPLGPSKKAVKAIIKASSNLHRYPDGSCYYLKEKLSRHLGVPPEMVIVGNGSNEIIELLIRAYVKKGDEVVMADPSFAVYPIVTKASGAVAKIVPLKDFTHNLPAMADSITPRTRVVFVANPNNPTGTIVTKAQFDRFMKKVPGDVIVCVDEAYFEFAQSTDFPDAMSYVKKGYPLVVLRTFSKIYGLAGLRAGYGVAHPDIVDYMNRVRQPFNVNTLAQAAALAALDDRAHLEKTRKVNSAGLKYLYAKLEKLGLEYVPTEANFFLIRVGDGAFVYKGLLEKGVIVRPMKSYGMPDYIRVTVGLGAENRRFVRALKEVTGL